MKYKHKSSRFLRTLVIAGLLLASISYTNTIESMTGVLRLTSVIAQKIAQICLMQTASKSEQIKNTLKEILAELKRAILNGKTQEAIVAAEQATQMLKVIETSEHLPAVVIPESSTLSSTTESNSENEQINNYIQCTLRDSLDKPISHDNFSEATIAVGNPIVRDEVLHLIGNSHGITDIHQLEHIKLYTQNKLNSFIAHGCSLVKEIFKIYKQVKAEKHQEELLDTQILQAMERNILFARAYHEAVDHSKMVITATMSTYSNHSNAAARLDMNRIKLSGSIGRVYNAIVQKLNALYFNKDGSFAIGINRHTAADLLAAYLKYISGTKEEYINHLQEARALGVKKAGLSKYIKQAQEKSFEITHENNTFQQFIQKIMPYEFRGIGTIEQNVINNNPHNKEFNLLLELCNPKFLAQADISAAQKEAWRIVQNYDRSPVQGYSVEMLNFYNYHKNNFTRKHDNSIKETPINDTLIAELTAAAHDKPTKNVTNTCDNAPDPSKHIIDHKPPVSSEIPDKGGVLVTPEHQIKPGHPPVKAEEVLPCGTADQIGNQKIPEGCNFGNQTLPSISDASAKPTDTSSNPDPNKDKPQKAEDSADTSKTDQAQKATQSTSDKSAIIKNLIDKGKQVNKAQSAETAKDTELIEICSSLEKELQKVLYQCPDHANLKIKKNTHPVSFSDFADFELSESETAELIEYTKQLLTEGKQASAIYDFARIKHIFNLEFECIREKLDISGLHHDYLGKLKNSGLLEYTDIKYGPLGTWEAKVWYKGRFKWCTFFPNNWTKKEVLKYIVEALKNFKGEPNINENGDIVITSFLNQNEQTLKIKVITDKKGKITSVYPDIKNNESLI